MSGNSFSSGIGESSVGGEGTASSGSGSGAGAAGGEESGFNIQEQGESGSGGGFFAEENVGESGGSSMGHAGSGAEFGTGDGQSFGGGEGGMPGNGSDGFFASNGTGSESGSGSQGAMGGEGGSGLEHDPNHQPYHGDPSMGGGSGSAMSGMNQQEARLADFHETEDLQDIHFAYDQYDLTEDSKEVLRANADWLKQNPDARIEIQGHCDERGTNNYNLGLGERRAISTMKFLAALGVESSRIFTISYGEEKPFCFDSNDACWEQNRRAHFMVAR
ncbi:MAG: peptidoglycan-associated lipoprotein Pal [Nitrospina sp.]|nr:peptidoglycan-associated lipoprotein Pal [Nitrospina sp.]